MFDIMDEAIQLLEKANAALEPELLQASDARALLDRYARARRLVDFGVAALSRKVGDVAQVARATGTSMGAARATVATGMVMRDADVLSAAFQAGEVSLDQATEIAKAEESAPGAAKRLLPLAQSSGFHVLKDKARAIKLEAEQHRDLGQRQREARYGRSYSDELGMVHVHLALEPHVGTPIVARAEAEGARLAKGVKKEEREPFERYLADAYARLLSGAGKGRAKRPELVVLVSYEVAERGWKDMRDGEVCKIPGVGPVPPEVARAIAKDDAFLNGLFYDGTDLRHFKRWGRHIPVEVAVALELGDPPDFDGVVCVDCGNRFRTEFDHVEPHTAGGPVSTTNIDPRCRNCHLPKTERDRKAGKLTPPEP
jgi:hypothetical protein